MTCNYKMIFHKECTPRSEGASSKVLFFRLMLRYYDYNIHDEGLLPVNLCFSYFIKLGTIVTS